jgi:hypothetical protein
LSNFHLQKTFGKIHFCHKLISPNFEIKIQKKEEAKAEVNDKK